MRKSSFRSPLRALAAALAFAGPVFAHGGAPHLMGTAESVSAEKVVVKDTAGASHDVAVGPKTRYRTEKGKAAEASDLKPGDRVVVHFGAEGASAPAAEIRFNGAPKGEKNK